MEYLLGLLDHQPAWVPAAALLALLLALVVVINWQGRKLTKHDELLSLLDVRVGNIHKDREATRVRKMRNPLIVPPPLPPRAPTIDATDWEEELVPTEVNLRDTARYPLGEPPTEEGNE